jgi:hypothetical protein
MPPKEGNILKWWSPTMYIRMANRLSSSIGGTTIEDKLRGPITNNESSLSKRCKKIQEGHAMIFTVFLFKLYL